MQNAVPRRGGGIGFLGIGLAFMAIGMNDKAGLLGTGVAFFALGIAGLVRARSKR